MSTNIITKSNQNIKENIQEIGNILENCQNCPDIFKENNYCFYANCKAKIMILMQNPGMPRAMKKLKKEWDDLKEANNFAKKVGVWQKYLKKWILEDNDKEMFLNAS